MPLVFAGCLDTVPSVTKSWFERTILVKEPGDDEETYCRWTVSFAGFYLSTLDCIQWVPLN